MDFVYIYSTFTTMKRKELQWKLFFKLGRKFSPTFFILGVNVKWKFLLAKLYYICLMQNLHLIFLQT